MPSSFAKKVWKACSLIPKGKISTYSSIARAIGKPNASRAIGNALNKSPGMPKCPCHRVVKSNGSIGGFAKGKRKKIELLKKEGIKIRNSKIINLKNILYHF
ncbi:MAG: MGMT family protein [Candidatus Micrarchaeota archaeon]